MIREMNWNLGETVKTTLRGAAWMSLLLAGACAEPPAATSESSPVPDYSAPIVLFVSPDSQEVERVRQRLGDDFHAVADDAMWYRAAAYELLDSLRIPHTEVGRGEARFRVRGKPTPFSWERVEGAWFLVLYDGVDPPRIASDVDLREELRHLRRNPSR